MWRARSSALRSWQLDRARGCSGPLAAAPHSLTEPRALHLPRSCQVHGVTLPSLLGPCSEDDLSYGYNTSAARELRARQGAELYCVPTLGCQPKAAAMHRPARLHHSPASWHARPRPRQTQPATGVLPAASWQRARRRAVQYVQRYRLPLCCGLFYVILEFPDSDLFRMRNDVAGAAALLVEVVRNIDASISTAGH